MVVEAYSIECASEDESMEICSDELKFVDKFCSHESNVSEAFTEETCAEPVGIQPFKFKDPMDLERKETEKCEKGKEEEKVKPKRIVVLDNGKGQYWKLPTKKESKVHKVNVVGNGNDEINDLPKLSEILGEEKKNEVTEKKEEDVSLRSFGSMRKEKEWRRTLACKLFEERHNGDAGQDMDQLWETYETQTEKKQTEKEKKKQKKSMMKKKVVVEEEEEDEDDQQRLCCLQALKFSTGKMHLGIARPNLLKLSKAFKGFKSFYNVTKKA